MHLSTGESRELVKIRRLATEYPYHDAIRLASSSSPVTLSLITHTLLRFHGHCILQPTVDVIKLNCDFIPKKKTTNQLCCFILIKYTRVIQLTDLQNKGTKGLKNPSGIVGGHVVDFLIREVEEPLFKVVFC